MRRFVDLHLHYVPGVDDGVRDAADACALLAGLASIGFARCIATPHIRADMFPNDRPGLVHSFQTFAASVAGDPTLPELGLGAEHFVDDGLLDRVGRGAAIPYPGERAILIELPPSAFPLGLGELCFRLRSKRLLPVLAHPERYAPLYDKTDVLDPLLELGVAPLLDLMSLVGRYGRAPQRAAERMLDEGVYVAACSDAHGPADVPRVESALRTLERRVGRTEAEGLLITGPHAILQGTLDV